MKVDKVILIPSNKLLGTNPLLEMSNILIVSKSRDKCQFHKLKTIKVYAALCLRPDYQKEAASTSSSNLLYAAISGLARCFEAKMIKNALLFSNRRLLNADDGDAITILFLGVTVYCRGTL